MRARFLAVFFLWMLLGSALALAAAQEAEFPIRPRPGFWAQPMIGAKVGNLYRVSEEVYRSEQPSREEMAELERFGIRSVLSLREYHDDEDEAKGTGVKVYRVAMNAGEIKDGEILEALRIIRKAEKPILIHCWHGSDRTGVVVAMYRLVFQKWYREDALDELRFGGYGYHEKVYPNIREYLQGVDVEKFRKDLGLAP